MAVSLRPFFRESRTSKLPQQSIPLRSGRHQLDFEARIIKARVRQVGGRSVLPTRVTSYLPDTHMCCTGLSLVNFISSMLGIHLLTKDRCYIVNARKCFEFQGSIPPTAPPD